FPTLKLWLDTSKEEIMANGSIYSLLGRKRRLPNVKSKDQGIASHEVRSGINFLVQSVASDINLLAAVELNDWVREEKVNADIFALVHDSIVAHVKEEDVEKFCKKMAELTQKERGVSILGCPIGVDVEIGDDYSFGKFEKQYSELV
ncbi:MAG TPA: DNA polymerase, partial [Marine Group III euryarchaeote]|nr:DNA polymerase [Marine Group III euryarchaeote]